MYKESRVKGSIVFHQGVHLIESNKLGLKRGVRLINAYRKSNKTLNGWRCPSYNGIHLIESQIKLGLNGGARLIKVSTL